MSFISPRKVKPVKLSKDEVAGYRELRKAGIDISREFVHDLHGIVSRIVAGDAASVQAPITSPSITTPIQFLQYWMPDWVSVVTTPRKADELIGITATGRWFDEEIVQGITEEMGNAVPYGDTANVPLSEGNVNFERRTIIVFEQGLFVGNKEQERASTIRWDIGASKRRAAACALEISRNRIAFNGYNGGANRTWGIFNDPALPAYITLPNGASGKPAWSGKTFDEICADIRLMAQTLQTQSQDLISPNEDEITMAMPTSQFQYLTVMNSLGTLSVQGWIDQTYKKMRIVTTPEFNICVGNAPGIYMYAESVDAGENEDSQVWLNLVPQKLMTVGVEKKLKGYVEDYLNAVAGVMLRYPWAVVRATGN